jgi:hypothetical protein
MTRIGRWVLIGGCLAFNVWAPAKDTTLTADQIVDRYVAACGGIEAWKKIDSMAWTGHIEASDSAMSSVPFLMELKRPNRTRFEVVVQNNRSARIFDGSKGWKVGKSGEGGTKVQNYSAEEIDFARDAAGLDGPLMDYRTKGVAVAVQGMGEVEGHRAYRLRVTLPSGAVHNVWIDAQTFLELKYEREVRTANSSPRTVSVYYRQYQTVAGLTLPMTIETGDGTSSHTDKMVIERVAFNPKLEESAFAQPLVFNHHSVVAIGQPSGAGAAPPGRP